MNTKFINFLIVLVVLVFSGCAKKTQMKYAEPEAIKECEENFYRQFYTLFSNQEEKELKNIKTTSECREFQDRFWQIRDTDPTTPQNEYKEEKEKLAGEIKNEILFSRPGTVGFLFKNNGDFNGDPGKVYMLHGMPDYTETLDHGSTYVNIMLWIYSDEENKHKYRFLFYQKNGLNNYVILHPHFDILYNLQEINKNPSTVHPLDVYYELERETNRLFLYSMVYFSDYPSLSIDKALRPPRPALEIAKELAPQIIGNEPEKEIVISNSFGSFIPAEFSYKKTDEGLVLKVVIRYEDLDWIFKNNELKAELFIRISATGSYHQYKKEDVVDITSTREEIEKKESVFVFESIPIKFEEESTNVNIYIKNNNKYNSWIEEIKK